MKVKLKTEKWEKHSTRDTITAYWTIIATAAGNTLIAFIGGGFVVYLLFNILMCIGPISGILSHNKYQNERLERVL